MGTAKPSPSFSLHIENNLLSSWNGQNNVFCLFAVPDTE